MKLRIGLGRDLHSLEKGRRFLLAGVELFSDRGMAGHSDGDVLAHAVIDALLGAAGAGDIGVRFPSGDPLWKDADSMELLKQVWKDLLADGWRLVNLDCVVSCERPPIFPYREKIRAALAAALDAETDSVFVKGKTGEGLGPIGENLAAEALAVCLLEKN